MKVFSKEKFIEVMGKAEYDKLYRSPRNGENWVDGADGTEVKDGKAGCYGINDAWCIEVEEKENPKMTINDFVEKKIAVIIKEKHDLRRFLAMCDEAGLKWLSDHDALSFEPPIECGRIAVMFNMFNVGRMTYCNGGEVYKAPKHYTLVDVSEFFDKEKSVKYQIVIECDDNKTTTARMIVDGREVKRANARRSPDDKFSLATGAKIAFDRLFEKK